MFKKGQVEIKEMLITIVLAGVLFIVGLLIFSNVSNSAESILDPSLNSISNESIAIEQNPGSDNSTLLAESRILSPSIIVRNRSDASEIIVLDTDYTLTLTGGSGAIGTRVNFTWKNVAYNFSNTTGVFGSYDFNSISAAQATSSNLQSTVLDSFSLGVIALIVLAAVAILAILFKLGSQ